MLNRSAIVGLAIGPVHASVRWRPLPRTARGLDGRSREYWQDRGCGQRQGLAARRRPVQS
jgi:hypothetical protein